jgi:hypothetical protein
MRSAVAACALAFVLALATSAQAEKRIFIIANNADGYGVDRCLATGASCGATVAGAYCRSQDFSEATSFRKVDATDIAAPTTVGSSACASGACDAYVAIECAR